MTHLVPEAVAVGAAGRHVVAVGVVGVGDPVGGGVEVGVEQGQRRLGQDH